MKLRHRTAALIALGLGISACGRDCTCISGEKTYEKVKGKYEVSLVRKTHWTGGRLPGPISEFFIHVETSPPIDEPIYGCTHADMKEDKDGKYVGFRCQGPGAGKEWTVLRLRGGDRRIRECGAPVGTGDEPDWTKLESVRASTTRVFGCDHFDASYAMRELAHAVLEDEGSAVAAEYVTTLASLGSARNPDPWDASLNVIDAPTRAATLAKLCPLLATGKAEPAAYVRAARHCPLEPSGALTMLRALLADPARIQDDSANLAFVWAGLLAAQADPKETGAVLCKAANDGIVHASHARESAVAELLGRTHTKCAIVAEWLKTPPCNFLLDCDGGLCTERELEADLAGWDDDLDAGVRADPKYPERDRAVLHAAYAAGPLPKELTLPNQRRRYDLPDASDDLAYCSDPKLDAGAECRTYILPLEMCQIPVDQSVLEQSDCTIHIDDAHRRFDTPRRVCEKLGDKCPRHPCCGDALCQDGVCVVRPVPDAATD